MSTIPDVLGTKYYLLTIKAITDSFLDIELLPLQRVENICDAEGEN